MSEEVAMFIDLENLRYGLLNNYGIEPDFAYLAAKAKKYGRPSMMRAYADFSEHPRQINRELQVAGIEAMNIPVTRTKYYKPSGPIERVKNAADMALALDAVTQALEADKDEKIKTFIIVAGDKDYIRLATLLRNKFGQRIVICGVPGSVSSDLEKAAGEIDHYEVGDIKPAATSIIKPALAKMIKTGPSPLKYWTLGVIDQWAQDVRNNIPGTAKGRRDAIHELMAEGIIVLKDRVDEKRACTIKEAVLNEELAREKNYI